LYTAKIYLATKIFRPVFIKSEHAESFLNAWASFALRAEKFLLSYSSSFLLLTQKKRSKRKVSLAGAAPRK